MFRIKYLPKKAIYQLHSSRYGAFEGDLVSISKKAIEMGLSQDELTVAYEVMVKNKDLVAEFGINGSFMYSHNELK